MRVMASPITSPRFEDYKINGSFSMSLMTEKENEFKADLKAFLNRSGFNHQLTGEVVRFPIADGYAQYMVADANTLIHLPLGDAWQIPGPHARGLRISDIKAMVERDRKRAELWKRKD